MATFKVNPKKKGKGQPEPVVVDGPFIRIGRNMNLDVILEDMLSAYEHARIEHLGTAFVIEDVGSHSGTYVNGASVQGRVPLAKDGLIVIGATLFTVKECDPANATIELVREELAPPKPGKAKSKEEAGEGATVIERRGLERLFTWPRLFSYGGCIGCFGLIAAIAIGGGQAAFMNGPLSHAHADSVEIRLHLPKDKADKTWVGEAVSVTLEGKTHEGHVSGVGDAANEIGIPVSVRLELKLEEQKALPTGSEATIAFGFGQEKGASTRLGCNDCHSPLRGVALETCARCHLGDIGPGNSVREMAQRPHSYPYVERENDPLKRRIDVLDPQRGLLEFTTALDGNCRSCHDEHQGADGKIAPTHMPAADCRSCHESFHDKYAGETARVVIPYDVFPHDKHLNSQVDKNITCDSCHSLPGVTDVDDDGEGEDGDTGGGGDATSPAAEISADDFPTVGYAQCIGCHQHKEDAVEVHGKDAIASVCSKCHGQKDDGSVDPKLAMTTDTRKRVKSVTFDQKQGHKQFFSRQCDTCHVDDEALDLPSKVTAKKFIHAPHLTAVTPGQGPASLENLEKQCVECHGAIAGATDVAASQAIVDGENGTLSTCGSCHTSPDGPATPKVEFIENISVEVPAFAHADHLLDVTDEATRARLAGSEGGKKLLENRCFACHQIETTQGPDGAAETVTIKQTLADCAECHTKKHEQGEVAKCVTCHSVDTDALFNPSTPIYRDTKPNFYSHRSEGSARSEKGDVKSHVQMVKEMACAECHSDVPKASTIKEIGYPELKNEQSKCQDCHPGGEVQWDCYSNCHNFHVDPMLERIAEIAAAKAPAGGGSDEGGSDEGGSDEGGSDEGGSDEGGSDEGGSDEGGSDEGGSDEGGSDEGGSDEGGSGEGGSDEGGG